jgi:hypothetical protein
LMNYIIDPKEFSIYVILYLHVVPLLLLMMIALLVYI